MRGSYIGDADLRGADLRDADLDLAIIIRPLVGASPLDRDPAVNADDEVSVAAEEEEGQDDAEADEDEELDDADRVSVTTWDGKLKDAY